MMYMYISICYIVLFVGCWAWAYMNISTSCLHNETKANQNRKPIPLKSRLNLPFHIYWKLYCVLCIPYLPKDFCEFNAKSGYIIFLSHIEALRWSCMTKWMVRRIL